MGSPPSPRPPRRPRAPYRAPCRAPCRARGACYRAHPAQPGRDRGGRAGGRARPRPGNVFLVCRPASRPCETRKKKSARLSVPSLTCDGQPGRHAALRQQLDDAVVAQLARHEQVLDGEGDGRHLRLGHGRRRGRAERAWRRGVDGGLDNDAAHGDGGDRQSTHTAHTHEHAEPHRYIHPKKESGLGGGGGGGGGGDRGARRGRAQVWV